MKKIYIIRHGETEYNKAGLVQGCGIDAPLNDTGEKQAEAFYEKHKHIPFDKIYVSNLIRTEQSVRKFIDRGINYTQLEGLKEISWGIQEGVAFTPETSSQYQLTCQEWREGRLDAKIEGGESPVEVANRQKEAMKQVLQAEDEKLILICMHGRAMRIMMCWMLNYSLSHMDQFGHANTGLYVVNYTGKQFSIETFNQTSHLEGIEL